MAALTEQDIQRNMRDVAHAIAQQALEGLRVPETTVADLKLVAQGKLETNEVIRNIFRRFENVPLFQR